MTSDWDLTSRQLFFQLAGEVIIAGTGTLERIEYMRALSSALLIAAGLTGIGYILETVLPSSSVFTIEWQTQQYLIPYNVAAFWGCVAVGAIAGFIQAIRMMLRDMERLR
ncbi:MAG: hypothetical protein EPN47_07800 [Acidobacteria bacterium]|nr:MAG: hypothetical protein EPN47_07800 [Acidobacteriota bacterium]